MSAGASSEEGIKLGCGVRDITPRRPAWLAGFAHRDRPTAEVESPLLVKAFVLEDVANARRVAVVVGDLIGWSAEMSAEIEVEIVERHGLDVVIFSATHTHSGPCVFTKGPEILSRSDPDYLKFLRREVHAAIGRAMATREPVVMSRGAVETAGLAVNRRLPTETGMATRPNPAGDCDPEMQVWKFTRPAGTTVAIWLHFACHPTILSGHSISSEFPGRVTRALEAAHPGVVCAYLQGCAGDVRPNLTDGAGFFRKAGEEDLENFSGAAEAFAKRVLLAPMEPTGEIGVQGWRREIVARAGNPEVEIPLRLTAVRIARDAGLVALPGEPSVTYQHFVKSLSAERVWPLGYCNGLPGYLPSAAQIAEGGYESMLSCPVFGLPGPFAPELEADLRREVSELVRAIGLG